MSGARPADRISPRMVGLPLGVAYSHVLAAVQLCGHIALLCPRFSLESQTLAQPGPRVADLRKLSTTVCIGKAATLVEGCSEVVDEGLLKNLAEGYPKGQ